MEAENIKKSEIHFLWANYYWTKEDLAVAKADISLYFEEDAHMLDEVESDIPYWSRLSK